MKPLRDSSVASRTVGSRQSGMLRRNLRAQNMKAICSTKADERIGPGAQAIGRLMAAAQAGDSRANNGCEK